MGDADAEGEAGVGDAEAEIEVGDAEAEADSGCGAVRMPRLRIIVRK